jgi:hypothetical protein
VDAGERNAHLRGQVRHPLICENAGFRAVALHNVPVWFQRARLQERGPHDSRMFRLRKKIRFTVVKGHYCKLGTKVTGDITASSHKPAILFGIGLETALALSDI